MAEGIPEGDEVRRIIINAKGEVKNVVPPVPEPQKESETPEKTSGSNTAETAAKIGAGIAVGEIGEALINQVGKTARKILYGGSGERGKSRVNTGGESPKEPPSGGKKPEPNETNNNQQSKDRETHEYYDKQEAEIRESIGKRSFMEIQSELASLAKSPNPTKESVLKIERQKPLRVAEEIGVIDKLKGHFLKIQATLPFNEARVAIARVDIENLENECTAFFGWDDKLKGILGEYRDVALLYMDKAELVAQGLESSGQVRHINEQLRVRAWGTPPVGLERMAKEYLESLRSAGPVRTTGAGGGNEYYDAMKKFYGEREPSFELALKEFLRAERLCEFYKIEDHKLISDKIKDEDERRIFEIEVKIFNTALIKRFQGAGTMTGVGENSSLKTISTPELVYLFKNMEGYLFAMQEIANIVVNRENVGDLDFTLLDCRSQDQFILAANELDEIVKQRLVSEGRISADAAEFLAQRSVSAALNTMYAFNVFEYYDTDWKGNIRYMFKESETTAPPGKQGPSVYDRLIAKPIMDAFCPMDDFLGVVFKADEKNPTPDILVKWAKYQLGRRGVKSFKDFDAVEVVGYGLADTWRYWTVKNKELDGEKVPAGEKKEKRRVLLVPPVRPSRIWGSILDVNNVKLTGGSDEKAFLNALADHDEIDFDNVGLASNAAALYTLDAPDLDTLKNVLRGRDPKDGLPEVMKVLGTFKLGKRMELIAWIHAGMIHGIDYKTSSPNLNRKSLYASRIQREFMGLPKTDKFNLINYLRGLNDDQKIKWDS